MSASGVQLRHVEYFVAVAREGHFARAAAACRVAQPTLSGGLLALEEALGRRLVHRDRRFVGLTPEGEAVLPWAQRLLADQAEMVSAAVTPAGPLEGQLVLGSIPSAMPLVGPFTRALGRTHPKLKVQVRSLTSRQIGRGLAAFELDAGLTYLDDERPPGVIGAALYAERYLFATRRSGPSAGEGDIGWAEAAKSRLCLLTADMQYRRMLDAHMDRLGLVLEPERTADSYAALLSLVHDGGLACILPHAYAALVGRDPEIALRSLHPPAETHAVGLVISDREPRSPLAQAALDAARSSPLKADIEAMVARG